MQFDQGIGNNLTQPARTKLQTYFEKSESKIKSIYSTASTCHPRIGYRVIINVIILSTSFFSF